MYKLLLTLFVSLSQQATLIAPAVVISPFSEICVSHGTCCQCSKYDSCDATNNCDCGYTSTGDRRYGQTCLLNYTENLNVEKQQLNGADETLISQFNTLQAYEFLKSRKTTTLTIKQMQAIQDLGVTTVASTTQLSVVDWWLRILQLASARLLTLTSLETNAKQAFQISQIETLRKFMYKRIALDPNELPYQFDQQFYSAQISKWKETTAFKTMTVDGVSFDTAQCEYKWRSVLIKYKLVVGLSDSMTDSFTNSTFKYNSTVAYCMFLKKNGEAYFPPSSEFHYWQFIPPFTYEEKLKSLPTFSEFGCYQIKSEASTYKLNYNNQECQYRPKSTSRPLPYCQCNEPGLTFVQGIFKAELAYSTLLQISLVVALIILIS